MHLDNVNRWKTVIQKLKTKNKQQRQQNPQTKSFSDYKVMEMELRKASRDLLILSFLTFGNMTAANVATTFFHLQLTKKKMITCMFLLLFSPFGCMFACKNIN